MIYMFTTIQMSDFMYWRNSVHDGNLYCDQYEQSYRYFHSLIQIYTKQKQMNHYDFSITTTKQAASA
jgi:hypothetical protein